MTHADTLGPATYQAVGAGLFASMNGNSIHAVGSNTDSIFA